MKAKIRKPKLQLLNKASSRVNLLKLRTILIPFLLLSLAQLCLPQTQPDSIQILKRIILIGDAGEPAKDIQEPVLIALENEAIKVKDSTLIIFLGDNIYPSGLPDENDPDRKEYERRIDEQINTVVNSGVTGIFIPGNHDWDKGGDCGWAQIKREEEYVNGKGLINVSFLPKDGCPGPVVREFGDNAEIIFLDSQWWLQDKDKRPEKKDSLCKFCTEDEIISALDSIIINSGNKFILVAAHHPLSTHGPHGGNFTWLDHIFPLRNLNEDLWIPLPLIGSLYPLIRGMGVSSQDISSTRYTNMISKIEAVIVKEPSLVYASGHEHALQVLRGREENPYLVSGAGIFGHLEDSLGKGDDTIFAGRYSGFMVIDFLSNGTKKLSVIKVIDETGEDEVVFSMMLD